MRAGRSTAFGAAALLGVGGLVWACGSLPAVDPATAGPLFVVTQTPLRGGGPAGRLFPDERYPVGSRIVLVAAGSEPRVVRDLSGKLAASGAPSLSPAGDRVLFAGKGGLASPWSIYEVSIHGSRPRRVAGTEGDCIDPAYLAGDRIVFACTGAEAAGATWSLYTVDRNGSRPQRITYGPGPAFDPTPLADGRILFSMWQEAGAGRPDGGAVGLFTVNPDGGLLAPFAGNHGPPPWKLRARQTRDGGVIFLAGPGPAGELRIERTEMALPVAIRAGGPPDVEGREITAAEVLPDGGLLVAARAAGASRGIYRRADHGSLELVFDDPGRDEVEALPVAAMPPPRGRPSPLDPGRDSGTIVCYDAGRTDGTVGPPGGAPRPVAVELERLGADGSQAVGRRVEVKGDGSFLLEAPADVPLRVRTLDRSGRQIAVSSWFWIRPGEVRACFGCHEPRDTAPVNRPVLALQVAGSPSAGGAR